MAREIEIWRKIDVNSECKTAHVFVILSLSWTDQALSKAEAAIATGWLKIK